MAVASHTASAQQVSSDSSRAAPESAAYLILIDHSGSMNEKVKPPEPKTRWVEMQERAVGFLQNVGLPCRIWLGVFAGSPPKPEVYTLNESKDRQVVIERIQRGFGKPEGGTTLYDSLGMAFEEAERLSQQHPDRYISVMVYTDGKDEGSKKWSPALLQQRFNKLVDANRNMWLFYTRLPGGDAEALPISSDHYVEGSPRTPIAMQLKQDSFGLKSAKVEPRQAINLEFATSDENWKLLSGASVSLVFTPSAGQKIVVRPAATAFSLQKGIIPVALEVTNPDDLNADVEYAGTLKIKYPVMKEHFIQAPDLVAVSFQKQAPPKINEVRPADGATFAAGKPILFWVSTLQGTKILWDFGDGSSDTGEKVSHTYNTPGDRKVNVHVSAGAAGESSRAFTIHIIDVGVSIDPVTSPVLEGTPTRLSCTGRGGIERYEWVIDGQRFDGSLIGSGNQTRSELVYTFDRTGKHLVNVIGHAEKAVVQSEERSVDCIKLGLTVVQPQDKSTVYYGQKYSFKAEVAGPVSQVDWTIKQKGQDEPIHQIQRPVSTVGEPRVSDFEYVFAEATDPIDVEVEATARLPEQLQAAAPVSKIALRVEYTPVKVDIQVENRPYAYNEPVQFRLVPSEGYQKVTWDFDDGSSDESNNSNPIHTYKKYGAFRVKARVTGKGGQVVDRTATVTVIESPPQARPKVTSSGRPVESEPIIVGSTVALADESIGDIVKKSWSLDGSPIAEGQVSIVMNEPGEKRLKLRVEGPDGQFDEKTTLFRVKKKPEGILFYLALLVAAILYALVWRLFSRNQPRAWRVEHAESLSTTPSDSADRAIMRSSEKGTRSNDAEKGAADAFALPEFQSYRNKKVGDFWNYWHKRAHIRLGRIYPTCKHWASGAGKNDFITVSAPLPEGSITCSSQGDPKVMWVPIPSGKQNKVYRLQDSRAEPEFQDVYFRLQRKVTVDIRDMVIKGVVFLMLCGLVWYVWHLVFRSAN